MQRHGWIQGSWARLQNDRVPDNSPDINLKECEGFCLWGAIQYCMGTQQITPDQARRIRETLAKLIEPLYTLTPAGRSTADEIIIHYNDRQCPDAPTAVRLLEQAETGVLKNS